MVEIRDADRVRQPAGGSVEPGAIAGGVGRFLIGDVIESVLAGLLLPAAWQVRTIDANDDRRSPCSMGDLPSSHRHDRTDPHRQLLRLLR